MDLSPWWALLSSRKGYSAIPFVALVVTPGLINHQSNWHADFGSIIRSVNVRYVRIPQVGLYYFYLLICNGSFEIYNLICKDVLDKTNTNIIRCFGPIKTWKYIHPMQFFFSFSFTDHKNFWDIGKTKNIKKNSEFLGYQHLTLIASMSDVAV